MASGISRRSLLKGAAGAAAGATVLAGCGRTSASASEPLEFWNFYTPNPLRTPTSIAQGGWFDRYIADWNKKNKQQVNAVFIPNYTGTNKLQTSFAAGSGPDIFLISPGDFLRYLNGGVLEDLTPYMTKEAIADYLPGSMDTRTVDGKIYALPMEQEPLAIYYSETVWEQAHLSEGDIPKTWEQLLDLADKLKTNSRPGLVFEPGPGYYQNFTWYPWMWQGGGDAVGSDEQSVFDSKAVVQALQLFQDGINRGVSPRTPPAAGDLPAAFDKGQAAMWQSGIWNVSDFRLRMPKTKYGIFRLPTPPGGKYATIAGGWAFCVNKRGRNPEAAAKFCVEAIGSMSPDSVKRVADWCTVAKSDVSPRKSALDLGTARGGYDNPVMKAFKDDIYPGTRGEPRYPPVIYKAISDAIQNTMLAGHKAADEAEIAAASIGAYLKSYEGAKIL